MKKTLPIEHKDFDGITNPDPSTKRVNRKLGKIIYAIILLFVGLNFITTKALAQCSPATTSHVGTITFTTTKTRIPNYVNVGYALNYTFNAYAGETYHFTNCGYERFEPIQVAIYSQTYGWEIVRSNASNISDGSAPCYARNALDFEWTCTFRETVTLVICRYPDGLPMDYYPELEIYYEPCSTPAAPTNLSAGISNTNTANLVWTASTSLPACTYFYRIYRLSDSQLMAWDNDLSSTSVSVPGLPLSTTYYATVFAKNACGTSSIVQSSYFTTPPNTPTSITSSTNGVCAGTAVTLTANGVEGTVYWYNGGCGSGYFTTGNSITVYPNSTTFYYARNYTTGGGYSPGCAATTINVTPAAYTPSSASTNTIGVTTANLSWASSSYATSYYWVVSTSSSATYGSAGSFYGSTTGTSASVSGLTGSTTYYLRVFASGTCGSSGYVTSSAFTTLTPPNPTITSFTPNPATIGQSIVINGTNFTNVQSIKINGTTVTSYTVNSSTKITATVPSGATSGAISITTATGSGTSGSALTVNKINQAISFSTLAAKTYGNAAYTISATGGASGNPVTFTSSAPTIASCTGTNGSTITILKAGNCTIYANQAGATDYNAAPQLGQTLTINKKELTVSGASASDKEYDATNAATVTGGELNGKVGTDDVNLDVSGTGTFTSLNVGTAIEVTPEMSITGNDKDNYTLTLPALTADISKATLSLSAAAANNRIYDATDNATWVGTPTGILASDQVIVSGTGTFDDKNIGTGKAVTATAYALTGTEGGNYLLDALPTGLTADVTAATLNITGVTASNKVYDGTTTATLSGGTLNGIISSDEVTIAPGTGAFDDKTVNTGKSVTATGYDLSGIDAGNYTLAAQPTIPNADITVASLTISGVTASNRVYDRTVAATLSGGTLNGIIGTDVVTITAGTGTFADKTVNTGKEVTAVGYGITGADAPNYTLSAQPSGITADISQAELTISGVTASNKAYDATIAATLNGGILAGIISGDGVTIAAGTGTFADKNVGTGKLVTATGYALSGADGSNYFLAAQPTGISADITSASIALTITGVTASNKVYDGNTTATLSGGSLNGIIGDDEVTITPGTGEFADKTVNTAKSVTATGYDLSGTDAGNYTLAAQPTIPNADITVASLTISGVTASNKVYDRTVVATLTGGTLNGIIGTDVVTITDGTGTFADKTVDAGKEVTAVGYGITGADAANYTLTAQPSGITADINKATLTISGAVANNKMYDATTDATISGETLNGIFDADEVTFSGTGTFADKTVDTGKPVTATGYTLGGADGANYQLSPLPTGLTADITVAPISITGITASDKVYDRTTLATLSEGTLSGILGTDEVTIVAGFGAFTNKKVGTNKTVNAIGFSIEGADEANYELVSVTTGLTATITAKPLTLAGVSASNKVYDRTTDATLTGGTLGGVIGTDVVSLTTGSGTFVDKTVGTAKDVTPTGYALSGTDAANYSIEQPSGLTADITPVSVTITDVTAANKVYDASVTATLNGGTVNGVINGDAVTITAGTGTFDDKTVGIAKPVTAIGYTLGGSDGSNYTLSAQPTGMTADITVATLDITDVTASSKVYDQTTTASLSTGSLSGVATGDDVILTAGTGTFANKTVDTDKPVTATGFSLDGTDAANYILSAQPSGLTANITAAPVDITGVTAANKVYDALITASLSGGTLNGVVTGDEVSITEGTGEFVDKNVGTAKEVIATGYAISGADAANYALMEQPSGITADITSAPVTITEVTAASKVYDASTSATLIGGVLNGVIDGDVVSITDGTGAFSDKAVATAKEVTATDYAIGGTDAANYTLTAQPTGITANITVATLDITGVSASNKVYDGTTAATLNSGSLSGVLLSDEVTLTAGSASFDNKTVGTNKVVTAIGFSLDGADATNYVLSGQPSELTADITTASISITGVTAENKVYDATTTATLIGGVLEGVIEGDVVSITAGAGAFADKTVGEAKEVTATGYTISGTDASNYTLTAQPTGITADITQATLTILGAEANNKVYDATTVATIGGGTLVGIVDADEVSFSATGTFADKTAETGKIVTATNYTLGGADGDNYVLASLPTGLTADITQASMTITGVIANNKVYDRTINATLSGGTLSGLIGSDDVIITSGIGAFANKRVGTSKTVTIMGFSLDGADAPNYALTGQPTGLTADITAAPIDIIDVTAVNKVYDTTNTATLSGGTLNGLITGDAVSITFGTGVFADNTAGISKMINTSGYGITGTDASNYTLSTQPLGVTANITQAPLTITGVTAANKTYDGTDLARLSGGILSGVLADDEVSITEGIGAFSDSNVGIAKVVTATGYSVTGSDASNYTLSAQPLVTAANITSASQTITFNTLPSKIYGDATFELTATASSGLEVSYISDNTSVANVSGTTVTIVGTGTATITARQIGNINYSAAAEVNQTLSINVKPISITGVTASNKVYDATLAATLSGGTLSGVVSGDEVTITDGTGVFADKAVGTAKVVTATGYGITGADVANYTLSAQPSELTADITTATVTIAGVTAADKVYNADAVATLGGGTLSGVLSSDVVTITDGTGAFADKAVGTAKNVTATGYGITGADADNYTLTAQPSGLTADITPSILDITGVSASNKVYDGTASATLNSGSLSGILSSDDVTLTAGSASFENKTVGTNKTVTASGFSLDGTDAVNYVLSGQPSGLTADITSASVSITGVTASNKVYDATLTATLSGGTLSGVVSGDEVTITDGTGVFADKAVGTAKVVTATGYEITGADVANYTLSAQPSGLTADITPSILDITGVSASNKVYDGTASATLNSGSLSGILSSDDVTLTAGSASFENKTVGTNKTVTASGFSLDGTDAVNYVLSGQPSGLTADITSASVSITGVTASNKVYDATLVATLSGGTLSGVVSGDEVTITDGTGVFADKAVGTAKVVTATGYGITGADVANYTLSAQPSELTADITLASLKITAQDKTKTYGSLNPEFTLSYSGFVGNETINKITNLNITCSADVLSQVGKYNISLSGGSASNYEISLVDGILEVTKAILTVTAEDNMRVVGGANPEFSLTYQGFINNETVNAIVELPTATTTANISSPAGEYQIVISGGLSNNYTFQFINGKLLITLIAGDTNGDGKITDPEIAGDINGDGVITSPEILGDTNGDGKIDSGEIAGDANGDGKIDNGETAGNTGGTGSGIAGDTNGDGKITDPEIAGDINGDGVITSPEILGDTNGDGKIDSGEIAGDANGDGKIDNGETAGNTGGTGSGIAGDTNGDGKITDPEIAGDINGDGVITSPEILGDTNGDGKIDSGEIAGDANGDGKIDNGETAGNTGGTGSGIAGDTNGDGKITDPEIAGDINGDGVIDGNEIAGDINGDGSIDGTEVTGDSNGDGQVTGSETTQTIVFLPLDKQYLGDEPFTVLALGGNSGNPVTFTSSDITVATCSGTNGEIITVVGAGTCTITAHQDGNSVFSAADDVSQVLKVDFNVGVEDNPVESQLIAYAIRNIEIRIKGEVSRGAIATLYDMSGRVIRIATLEESSLNVMPTPGLKTAIYVLSVNDHGKIQTFKIPVRE